MKDVVHRGLCGDLDIDRDVSTASCRTSSGDGVDLLSTTICANRTQ